MKYYLLFISAALMSLSVDASYKDLQLVTDERPPFEFKGANGKPEGVAVDGVRCALSKLDVKYSIKIMPWARAQAQVKAGKAHGFFAASRNDTRDAYAILSDVVVEQYWNWYLAPSITSDPSSDEFKSQVKVSSWLGSNSLKWLTKKGYKLGKSSKSNDELVKRLMSGRLDGVYASDVVFEKAVSSLGKDMSKLRVVEGVYKPMGIYFSKDYLNNNAGFMDSFNKA
ncbi:MAG: substrate-binding periplasmic protein, partial [Cellvibrionaceae bacterium]